MTSVRYFLQPQTGSLWSQDLNEDTMYLYDWLVVVVS
jgi:hypothetical protein